MAKASAFLHWVLAAYLWLISWISLGNWNAQPDLHLWAALRAGHPLELGDIGYLSFVTLPALLFGLAVWHRSWMLAAAALIFDFIWTLLQIQSWWIPYILGNAKPWQLLYSQGPTTKILPSFGRHVAPDAMHLVISGLLVAAIWTAILALKSGSFRRAPLPRGASNPVQTP